MVECRACTVSMAARRCLRPQPRHPRASAAMCSKPTYKLCALTGPAQASALQPTRALRKRCKPRRPGPPSLTYERGGERGVNTDAEADMPSAEASGAICVQRFDGSRNSAIHTTYRISLRSSSLREPRYPLLRVVFG